jgi:very-short-patch-repair endonuclease
LESLFGFLSPPGERIKVRGNLKMGRIRSTTLPKELRQRQTDAEMRLWYFLRDRQIVGFKFRRQHRIGRYVVDMACLEKKLIIEIDGGQHNEMLNQEHDRTRTNWLEKEGYQVIRFWDNDVLSNTEGVLETIRQVLVV